MNFNEYIPLAMRTLSPLAVSQTEHANLGLISELGELADAVKKSYAYGKPFDAVNAMEEVADICWYVALHCQELGIEIQTEALADAVDSLSAEPGISLYAHIEALTHMTADMLDEDSDKVMIVHCMLASLSHLLSQYGFTLSQALAVNIAKLSLRYGDKFSEVGALVRDLQAERALLVEGAKA